jgi:hypothetical protein
VTLCYPPRTASMSHPSKEGGGTLERGTDAYPALAQDNVVTSGQRSMSPPSPPALCGHPRRCATIPSTAAPSPALWGHGMTRHRHTRYCMTSSLRQHDPRADVRTTAKQEAPTPLSSKKLLDRHRTCRDAPPEARFARTATHSLALYAIPPHVARTVRHECKPSPLGL